MENGAPIQSYPNQEDKSGRPTYAAAARNSSTIDPRSIQAEPGTRNQSKFTRFTQWLARIFKSN